MRACFEYLKPDLGLQCPASASQATIDGLGWPDQNPWPPDVTGLPAVHAQPPQEVGDSGVDGPCQGSLPAAIGLMVSGAELTWGRPRLSSHKGWLPQALGRSLAPSWQQGGPAAARNWSLHSLLPKGPAPSFTRSPGQMTFRLHHLVRGQRPSPAGEKLPLHLELGHKLFVRRIHLHSR